MAASHGKLITKSKQQRLQEDMVPLLGDVARLLPGAAGQRYYVVTSLSEQIFSLDDCKCRPTFYSIMQENDSTLGSYSFAVALG